MIDAHQHFWKFDPVRDSWIDNKMQVIQRDFMPTDLQPLLAQSGIEGCVTVQSDQSEMENEFQLANAAQHDFIKGVVGWVDLKSDSVQERLDYYSGFPKMKGFRHVLQGEPQHDYMLRKDFRRGIGLLLQYGFTYDVLILPDQLCYTKELVTAFPNLKFVIDHLAKPDIKGGNMEKWKADIEAVAAYENVYCKVSGMVTEADWQRWKPEDFKPYLDIVTEAFGMKRLMFGSDWPVCNVAGGYANMLGLVRDYYSAFSAAEQADFFGNNAIRFYHL